MKLLSMLLFESVDQRRAKVVERLAALKAKVSSNTVSSAVKYGDAASNQKTYKAYAEIDELEKELEVLDKKIAKRAAEMAAKKKTETQPAA